MRGRKGQGAWIQPCLKLPRAVPGLFGYMCQTFEILPLATLRILKTNWVEAEWGGKLTALAIKWAWVCLSPLSCRSRARQGKGL